MLLLFWTLYYLLDQSRIRNIKEPTLLWCIPSQMLLFSLYRSEFLPYTIFFLKNICQHFLQSKSTRDSLRFLIKKNYLFPHPFWRIISRIQHSIWRFFFQCNISLQSHFDCMVSVFDFIYGICGHEFFFFVLDVVKF